MLGKKQTRKGVGLCMVFKRQPRSGHGRALVGGELEIPTLEGGGPGGPWGRKPKQGAGGRSWCKDERADVVLRLDPCGEMWPQTGSVGERPRCGQRKPEVRTRQARPGAVEAGPPAPLAASRTPDIGSRHPSQQDSCCRHASTLIAHHLPERLPGEAGRRRDRPCSGPGCTPRSPGPAVPGRHRPTQPPSARTGRARPHGGAGARRLPQRRVRRTKGALGTSASVTWSHLLPGPRTERHAGIRLPRRS